MRMFFLSCSVIACVFLSGCSDGSAPSTVVVAAVNTNCPIMGGKVTDDGGRTEFDGKTIGFCCPGCIEQWNALSDEQKAEKLSAADKKDVPSDADQADHSTHEDHAEHGDEKEPVSE